MKRRLFLVLLAACLGLSACQSQTKPEPAAEVPATTNKSSETKEATETEPVVTEAVSTVPASSETEPAATQTEPKQELPDPPVGAGLGLDALDAKLIAYLQANGLEQQSFTVSPLSLKAALALTALGAEGETQRQILDALGFDDVEALKTWYATVLAGVADFDSGVFGEDREDSAYHVVNAIFHNASCDGEFREEYKELVGKVMGAYASSHSAEEITKAINDWVDAQTEGMIPSIVEDASQSAAVLVNALYLKTKWTEPFNPSPVTDFTTVTGETVQKEFITKTEKYRYYADEACQLVVLPLQGGINMVLVLGDGTDLAEKLSQAKSRKTQVTLPKFEVETSFDKKELVQCLQAMGCSKMFTDSVAEFDPMFTKGVFVDDIIQKAKVQVDENGLEAAAATAVIMTRNTAMPNPEEPVEFTADRPFQFAIVREDETPELLFWGQIMD